MDSTEVNITALITQTINNLFSNLFASIDNSLYSVLDDLVFINSDIIHTPYLENIIGSDKTIRHYYDC